MDSISVVTTDEGINCPSVSTSNDKVVDNVMPSSYSWERSSDTMVKTDDNEELLVFGYSCKLFRDEERARHIDSGKHLIPWMGDESLLIDRFDVRGYLHDLKSFQLNNLAKEEQLSAHELEIENICDKERFADLEDHDDHEEELKRLHLALASDGPGIYNEIPYSYDSSQTLPIEESTSQTAFDVQLKPEEAEKDIEDFILPSGLSPPKDMLLPSSQKLHNIIEKTALFVSQNGPQMEIILKMKQSDNSSFDFLTFDTPLNPYYKFVLTAIKSGQFVPKNEDKMSDDDSDSDGSGHYLHPSLLGSKQSNASTHSPIKIPHIMRKKGEINSYSQLVKSLGGKFEELIEEGIEDANVSDQTLSQLEFIVESRSESESNTSNNHSVFTKSNTDKSTPTAVPTRFSSILPFPPPEVDAIIEKLASHVAKTGDEFELSIKRRNEERFSFLNPGNSYHAHYIRRKLHHLEEIRKAQAEQMKLNMKKNMQSKIVPVSFSITTSTHHGQHKESKSGNSLDDLEQKTSQSSKDKTHVKEVNKKKETEEMLKDKLANAARERLSREKQLQEERKKKAALFISLLKSKQAKANGVKDETEDDNNAVNTYGPELPQISEPKLIYKSLQITSSPKPASPKPNSSPISTSSDPTSSTLPVIISKQIETIKTASLLPFISSDKPLKESSLKHSSSPSSHRRHHRHKHGHHHKRKRSKSRTRSKSPNSSGLSSDESSRKSKRKVRSFDELKSKSKSKSKLSSRSRSRSRERSHSKRH